MPEWTDELKAKVISEYVASNPTPETSGDIVKQIAEEFDATPNGVRMILTKAGVYIKKAAATSAKGSSEGTKRVSKQDALDSLTTKIEALGLEVDDTIVSKLTGKAAIYITELLNKATD